MRPSSSSFCSLYGSMFLCPVISLALPPSSLHPSVALLCHCCCRYCQSLLECCLCLHSELRQLPESDDRTGSEQNGGGVKFGRKLYDLGQWRPVYSCRCVARTRNRQLKGQHFVAIHLVAHRIDWSCVRTVRSFRSFVLLSSVLCICSVNVSSILSLFQTLLICTSWMS
jgi:hypothetical protein